MFKQTLKGLAIFVWLGILAVAFASVSGRVFKSASDAWNFVESPPFSEISPEFLDVVTLGHRGVVDDALLVYTLNYLVDERIKVIPPDQLFRALKSTTRLKPRIETIYMFGCLVMALDVKRPELCEPLIVDGIGLFPDGWRLPLTLGTILYNNVKDEARAAVFYEMASTKPDSPHYAGRFAAKLRDRSVIDPDEMGALIDGLEKFIGRDFVENFYGGRKVEAGDDSGP